MDEKIRDFLTKFARDEYTKKEHQQFLDWMKILSESDVREILDLYVQIQNVHLSRSLRHSQLTKKIETALDQQMRSNCIAPFRLLPLVYRAAIIAAVFFTTAVIFYISSHTQLQSFAQKQTDTQPDSSKSITTGGNKASLVLSDGTTIVLDDAANGVLAVQAGTKISKTADGQLKYDASQSMATVAIGFNTISTPRGGQFQLTLPDGSRVWLNAASSLKFPASFTGSERKVELCGEAYFEVAKNKANPFRVISGNQTVEVLGTHFNVNAYQDDGNIRTTLLEGSVKVNQIATNKSRLLAPGQQAIVEKEIRITSVDVEQSIAWKKGYFMFARENIKTVMQKIGRWYDVDIEYEGKIPTESFVGSISRFENVSEVLDILELTRMVHFRIAGRKIIVSSG